jgi:hypothetical protein
LIGQKFVCIVINTLPVKEAVPMIRSVTVNHLGYGRWDIRRRETKREMR